MFHVESRTAYGALTYEWVRANLDYEPETGILRWKLARSGTRAGDRAGTVNKGYRRIKVGGQIYSEHLVIWLWMTGALPSDQIDHKDRDGTNNRWENLREATQSQNQANRELPPNKTGFQGVYAAKGRYRAAIMINGKRRFLGYHDCPALAHEAYRSAAAKFHGDFAKVAQ